MADYNVATPKFIKSGIFNYTMPYAPDLKITMINEMDGVDRVRTRGGHDLVNHRYHKNPGETRTGRRSWLISYSYLGNSDFDDLYSKVIKKTNGGQLSFIFRPDSSQNAYSATCKFDMKSLQYKQVANGVYSVKLKIREVW